MTFTSFPDYREILRVPGFCFWGTTSLANEAGWGTKIGFSQNGVDFNPAYNVVSLPGETRGEETRYRIQTGTDPFVKVGLKNFNNTSRELLFPGLNNTNKVRDPGDILPGTNLNPVYTGRFLFVPWDLDNNPIFLAQQASPNIISPYRFTRAKDTIFQLGIRCLRKTNDPDGKYYIGPITDGVLR